MSVLLIEECWRLFESIWATRNTILHGSDSYATQTEESALLKKLLLYKFRSKDLLHYGDTHHISHPTGVIASWDRKRKKKMIRILDSLHQVYVQDCKLAAERQQKLTDFGFTIIAPTDHDSEAEE